MAIDAGTIYSEVRVRTDKLDKDLATISLKLNQLARKNTQTSKKVEQSWDKSFSSMKFAAVAAMAAITMTIKAGTRVANDFEQSLANVKSVASATSAEFAQLEKAAINAGESTRFTASQAADAMYSLASAGLDATQSIDALDGVLLLAGATQSDLAFTSETVSSALKQYSLDADKATDISNVFAAAIGNSKATMDRLSLALSYVGPVAGAMGISIEKTVGILEALLDAGFKGTTAGRALKSIFADLASESSQVTQKLKAQGLAYEDLNPASNEFADILDTINEKGLTAGQVIGIFGKEAGAQMVALLTAGGTAINKYTDEITGTNEAAKQYAIQNDTMSGSLDKLKSALESAAIKISQEFMPVFRPMVDAATEAVKSFNKLPGVIKVLITTLTVAIPTVGVATIAFTHLAGAIGAAGGAIALVSSPAIIAAGAIAVLTTGITTLVKVSKDLDFKKYGDDAEKFSASVQQVKDITKTFGKEAVESLAPLAGQLKLTSLQLDFMANNLSFIRSKKDLNKMALQWQQDLGISRDAVYDLVRATKTIKDPELLQYMDEYSMKVANSKNATQNAKDVLASLDAQKEEDKNLTEEEQAAYDAQYKALDKAAQTYRDTLAKNEVFVKAGAMTEEEALRSKVDAQKSLLSSLLSIDSAYIDTTTSINAFIKAIGATSGELAIIAADKKLDKMALSNIESLEEVGRSEVELLNIQRKRLNASVDASIGSDKKKNAAHDAINELYDKLELDANKAKLKSLKENYDNYLDEIEKAKKEAAEKEAVEIKKAQNSIRDTLLSSLGNLSSLFDAVSQNRIAQIDAELQAKLKANGLEEESTLSKLQTEDEANKTAQAKVIAAYDERIRKLTEVGDISGVKAQEKLKQDQLSADNEINEENRKAREKEKITAEFEAKKAAVKYKYDMASWYSDLASAVANNANAILKTMATYGYTPWGIGLAAAQGVAGGLQVSAVAAAKPQPVALATGGVVLPSSGGTLTQQAENGFGEVSFNAGPSGEALLNDFAARIASQSGSKQGDIMVHSTIEVDRRVLAELVVKEINNGNVRLKR